MEVIFITNDVLILMISDVKLLLDVTYYNPKPIFNLPVVFGSYLTDLQLKTLLNVVFQI